jgi:hypothetical protein
MGPGSAAMRCGAVARVEVEAAASIEVNGPDRAVRFMYYGFAKCPRSGTRQRFLIFFKKTLVACPMDDTRQSFFIFF